MQKVIDLPELEFDEKRHSYRLNGEIIPSVTTVMKPLSVDTYGTVDPEVLRKAGRRGTIVHEAVENYVRFGVVDIDPMYMAYLDAFIKFWTERKPKLVTAEYRMYHKYLRYAGTADLLVEIDDELWLIDTKTSAKIERMLTRVQLEAYDKALATHDIRVARKGILHLRGTGTYKLDEHLKHDAEAWDAFISSKTVYDYIKKGKEKE